MPDDLPPAPDHGSRIPARLGYAWILCAIVLGACGFERVIDLPTAQPTASPVPSSWTRSWELKENAGRNLTMNPHGKQGV